MLLRVHTTAAPAGGVRPCWPAWPRTQSGCTSHCQQLWSCKCRASRAVDVDMCPCQFVGSCVHFQRMGTGCQCLNLLFGLVICLLLLPCADSAISVCLGISKSPCRYTWQCWYNHTTMPGSGHFAASKHF